MLAGIRRGRFKAILSLIYHCGLRVGEAVKIRPVDIDAARGVIRILDGKGGKNREVPLAPAMLERLRRYWKAHRNPRWLFPGVGRGWKDRCPSLAAAMGQAAHPMSVSSVQNAMRMATATCGLKKAATCHTLRHSFATHLCCLTVTVPAELRRHCRRDARTLYDLLLTQSAAALRDLCRDPKHLGGETGFLAVLQTWTRRMLLHPHVHLLIPAVALSADGCQLLHPKNQEFLVPVFALAAHLRQLFRQRLARAHPQLYERLAPAIWQQAWVVHCQPAGRGRSALRYLAAYVGQCAFHEDRLAGYDSAGRVLLRYRDNADQCAKTEAVAPLAFIARWLCHVLPKGFVAVRHFGFLSPAAGRALRRVRFLLGRGPVQRPTRVPLTALCPCCHKPLLLLARLRPVRGPPLSRDLLPRLAA